jgi:SAM-dependent methyltransferase
MTQPGDQGDLAFLETNAAYIRRAELNLPHLDQTVNLLNYIRIANDIASQFPQYISPAKVNRQINSSLSRTSILDWGCGYGQMSWLLRRREFDVTSFDIGPDSTTLPQMPLSDGLGVTRTEHSTQLPFQDGSFDGVLSCGVLEHVDECSGQVGNERKALDEIFRVLKPGGKLLIYQLPQSASWQEGLVRRFKLGYSHPRRYSEPEINRILRQAGFEVVGLRRSNFIPKNLTGLPMRIRRFYSRFSLPLMVLDRFLCRVPMLNRIAGVLEVSALKQNGARSSS